MKKIIGKKEYNTETAQLIKQFTYSYFGDPTGYEEILYQTAVGEEEGMFSLEEVLSGINQKLRRRHPHIFDGVEANTPEEVDALWQKIKEEERKDSEL